MKELDTKKLNILAIIPARGGSKGFPGKNIYPLNGKPLISYTIEAALNSKLITKTVVSSDDDEILKVSSKSGAKILKRPAEFATDEASSESLISDTLNQLRNKDETFDILVLLQPTSPLRDYHDIDNAIQKMLKQNAKGIISVTNIGVKPFKAYYINEDGFLKGVHNNITPNMRRQDLPETYLANGAIYAVYVKQFIRTSSLLPYGTIPYIMEADKSIDLDTESDFGRLESFLASSIYSNKIKNT
jgi:CMP-N,N'-diacetyllegionaminic acid synthase